MSSAKAPRHPGPYIRNNVIPKGVSVTAAAKMLGVSRPGLSNLLNERAALSPQMAKRFEKAFGVKKEHLISMQQVYDAHVEEQAQRQMAVRSYAPSFLDIRAMNIATWPEKLDARPRLPALLRRLALTTGAHITEVDFPAYDHSQRHGWDGHIVCESPNPWVPHGISGWEFGCDANPTKKANGDFAARSKLPRAERLETTFVFVTPRNWQQKDAWVASKRAEGIWKDVRAYDANDLEQWLENSPSAQIWMADLLGIPAEGCQTLAVYWDAWAGIADPAISPFIFENVVKENAGRLRDWLTDANTQPLVVAAASREEGVAFLAATAQLAEGFEAFGQQAVIFHSARSIKRLAGMTAELVPVIYAGDLEKAVVEAFPDRKAVIVADRNVGPGANRIEIGPPNFETFQKAIKKMGLDEGAHASIVRGSSRSPTILRRLLAKTPGLIKPKWAQHAEHARWMVPFVLLGRWKWGSASDREILGYVADEPIELVEQRIAELSALDDSPILKEGDVAGVASRLESLNAVAGLITAHDLDRFMFVAECVLEEDDPSLDLEKSKRWSAAIYGKVREYSGPIRQSIGDALVLLSVHGPKVLDKSINTSVEGMVASLVRRLIKDREPRVWLSQQGDLPFYAEAAPNVFLDIVEEELAKPEPAFACLFEPVESGPFSRCDRTGMLWALELLAWSPHRLSRVVAALASLCRYRIDDNWVNKPAQSIRDILLSWRPHTMATLEQRIEVLEHLCEKFPEVGWSFCLGQLDSMHSMTSGTYQPRWRDDTSEDDRNLTNKDVYEFRRKCLDLALSWPTYDREKLEGLIDLVGDLPKRDQECIHQHIADWLSSQPSQSEIADLREHVRIRTMSRRARRHQKGTGLFADGRKLYASLEPADLLQRHRWLFAKPWVEYSGDELDVEDFDHKARDHWISKERAKALKEILEARGHDGIFELCTLGDTAYMIGGILASEVMERDDLLEFVVAAMNGGSGQEPDRLDQCVSGVLSQFGPDDLAKFLEEVTKASPCLATSDQMLRLHKLAPFARATWDLVSELGTEAEEGYWRTVGAGWGRFDDADLNFCVDRFLTAARPRTAFQVSHLDCEKLNTRTLTTLLHDMGTKDTEPSEYGQWRPHDIVEAFEVLNSRDDADQSELARLEFMYTRAMGSHSGYQFPNLSREIANSPHTFFHLVALCFVREDRGEDDPALEMPTNEDHRRNAAQLAYSALENVVGIPGLQEDGSVDVKQLREWVRVVRDLARKHDRVAITDQQIGHLLQRCGPDSDDIWPRLEVRQILEEVASQEMATGLHVAEHNSRGVQWRPSPDDGSQERDLAAKYRGFGEAVMNRTPFVARMLFGLADSYEREAEYHDGVGRRRERFPD